MHTFAEKPKATQQTTSAESMIPDRARFEQSPDVRSILHLQRRIGNQVVQRNLEASTEKCKGDSTIQIASFAHDFSKIPVVPPDRANPEAQIKDILGTSSDLLLPQGPEQSEIIRGDSRGEKLSPDARAAMETRFGYDLSRIRIHPNDRTAAAFGAKAFASGEHISFGPGRSPTDQRLLSHEIAHVVQQATGESTGLKGTGGDVRQREALEAQADNSAGPAPSPGHMPGRSLKALPAASAPIVQFDFEEDVLAELHRMPSAEEEGLSKKEQTARTGKLRERVQKLLVLFNGLSATDAKRIHDRLKVRKKGDVLSERFHDMLLTATRSTLLAILERHVFTTAPSLPLRANEICGSQKCLSDEDLQMPQEAKGPQASYDLAPGRYPRRGSKELKKGRMEWLLQPPQVNSPTRIQITFTPKSSYSSHTVTFLQTLLEGEPDTISSQTTVMDPNRKREESEPFYGADWDPAKQGWIPEGAPAGYKNAPSTTTEPSAYLYDAPVVFTAGMTRIFESVAVVPETAEILGSLRWGVTGDTILGAESDDCTDIPSASFDALMTAYYSPRKTAGGGPEPEHFDTILDGYAADGFELSGQHQQQLKSVIKKFLGYPGKPNKTQIAVSGFGDAKDEDPVFTSEMRANVAMRYLMDNGVPDTNIDIHSFGAAWARFPAGPSEDRNRRVQVRTYYK